MPNVRIKDQTTDTALTTGDYVIVDSETEGTRKYDLGALAARVEALEQGGSGLTQAEKQLILTLFCKAAYAEDDAGVVYDALEALWTTTTRTITYNLSHVSSSNSTASIENGQSYTTTLTASTDYTLNTVTVTMGGVDITSTAYSSGTITIPSVTGNIVITATAVLAAESITATYTQSGTVYTTDSINSLKSDLVVTANYAGGTSATVPSTDYTLSGTLNPGTNTITVNYAGLTDTFSVNAVVNGWFYSFNESLASLGTKDFGLTGQGVYGEGRDSGAKAYYHIIPTSGTASSDTQYGLKATAITDFPDFSGDFTISYWFAAQVNTGYMHPFYFTKYVNTSNPSNMLTSAVAGGDWVVAENSYNSNKTAGIAIQGTASGQLMLRLTNSTATGSAGVRLTIPSGFNPSEWHHYAITKNESIIRIFVDGSIALTCGSTYSAIYESNQLSILASFVQESTNWNNLNQIPNGGKMQDFYVAEFCKWTEDFDPSTITY